MKPPLREAFHDDLAGQRAGERGVLAGGEQRHGEDSASQAHAEDGREQLVAKPFGFGSGRQ